MASPCIGHRPCTGHPPRGGNTLRKPKTQIFAVASSLRSATGSTAGPFGQLAATVLQNCSVGDAYVAKGLEAPGPLNTPAPGFFSKRLKVCYGSLTILFSSWGPL